MFGLKTNVPRRGQTVVEVLRTYKGRSEVERRFHHIKGPLAVTPMFLEKPERMAGLVCVVVWALLVMALMERQVRQKLRGQPLYGLYPENRARAPQTAHILRRRLIWSSGEPYDSPGTFGITEENDGPPSPPLPTTATRPVDS